MSNKQKNHNLNKLSQENTGLSFDFIFQATKMPKSMHYGIQQFVVHTFRHLNKRFEINE